MDPGRVAAVDSTHGHERTEHDRSRDWRATLLRRRATARDGTGIAYEVVGHGTDTIVLANGLGGRLYVWEPLLEALAPHYRIVTWDYRGLFDSDSPPSKRRLAVTHHSGDLRTLLDAERIERAVLVGWSMGVQVSLDFAASHPDRVAGLVLLNGTYGHVLSTGFQPFFSVPFLARQLHGIIDVLRDRPELARTLATASKGAVLPTRLLLMLTAGARARAMGPILERYFDDVLGPSFENFLRLFQELDAHSTYHLLREIDAPTLVVSGLLDILTPAYQSRQIARRIRGAEHLPLVRSSHFSMLERPEVVVPRIERFLQTRARFAPTR